MVKIYEVILNFLKLLRSCIVFLEHFEVIFAQFCRDSLVMRNVLVDLHNHFVSFHASNFHILTQELVLLWRLILVIKVFLRKLSITLDIILIEPALATFIPLNILGASDPCLVLISWTEKEFLFPQTVRLHQVLLLAENLMLVIQSWSNHVPV